MPPAHGCPRTGPPSPEVTGAFCRVPSTPFSQAPWYALPVHLCRFRVRSISWGYFLERLGCLRNPISKDNFQTFVTSSRPRNINLVPIDYGFRPHLRGRLTLRGLALRRNPWTSGERVSHPLYRYSCQHSHFRYLQQASRLTFNGLRNAPLPVQKSDVRSQMSESFIFNDLASPWRGLATFSRFHGTHLANAATWVRLCNQGQGNTLPIPAFHRWSLSLSLDSV